MVRHDQQVGRVAERLVGGEQGEVIASKFGNPEIGRRNLETVVAAITGAGA